MDSRKLLLKCKSKNGLQTLNSLSGENTVKDLKACLSDMTNIEPDSVIVRAGYPPKVLDLSNENCRLDAVPLCSGETLIIEEKPKEVGQGDGIPASEAETFDSRSYNGGVILRHVVPANNSCLFTSIYFAVSSGDNDFACSFALRQIIADAVAADPVTYNDAFLGKPNAEYCSWILCEDNWGGAIEISILSKYYGLEIVAIDVQNLQLHRFGQEYNYSQRIFLIYDGIHYDTLFLDPLDSAEPIKTLFSTLHENVLQMALEVATEAKSSRQFTDVKNFMLRCTVCNIGLRGQDEARDHALKTQHCNFSEV